MDYCKICIIIYILVVLIEILFCGVLHCLFVFMTLSDCNIFISFLSLAIPRMSTLLIYIQSYTFDQYRKKRENIFILISFVHFYSSLHFTILYLFYNR